ncbi:adenylate/guanylate cyclase domain-containing protein [Desulfosarcina sp.]|uniref:adenylate/guanylate cyclase domain-containing protein n=1 Tax=Desulfosarcina sp. TaxID=2027861 RepID=UPI003970D48C
MISARRVIDIDSHEQAGDSLWPEKPTALRRPEMRNLWLQVAWISRAKLHFSVFIHEPIGSNFEQGKPNLLPIDSFASADGERRQATILFSDLSGYTQMNEKLDPEEVEAITSQIKSEAVRIVESYEGTVNQFVGDEVSALFGIPTTHEDDPIRAVRAALEIHRKVRQISGQVEDRTGIRLRMHTGINTGLIVTHTRDTRDGQYGITGDAVNTGARLAGLAGTDQVIVGPATYRLIAPYFNTTPLDAVTVAGKTKPLVPHLVTGETEVKTRFEATRVRGFTAFTGRGHEFSTLFSCFEKMLSGKGQFVTVVGDAGLGKSRLIYEFRHALNRSEITVMQGRCQSYGMSIPYFPFINALRRGFNLTEEDSPAELHEKTIANIRAIDNSLEQYLPILFHLLSITSEKYQVSELLHDQVHMFTD